MGCAGSKLDDLQAVKLCRERSQLLEAAIRHRYSLAHAHLCYLNSLRSVAASLHRFLDLDVLPHPPPSPFLPLPTHRKGDPSPEPDPDIDLIKPNPSAAASAAAPTSDLHHHSHSPSNSGSHLHFLSDSDSDSDISAFHQEGQGLSPPRYYMNYARSGGPASSVAFEKPPQSPETVQFAGSYAPYSAYPYPYPQPYAGVGSFFGVPPSYTYSASPPRYPAAAAELDRGSRSSSSQAPPPPPMPPSGGSAWDFLNPFESTASYYPPYTPSRDSTEVREKEGIPDLEDEDYQQEVVKEAYQEQKFVASAGRSSGSGKEESVGGGRDVVFGMRSSGTGESSGAEYDVHLVDKNVVEKEKPPEGRGKVVQFNARGLLGVAEAVSEIKAQFDRASESGGDVSKILEVGKLPYRGKNAVYKVSSKMLDVITLTLQPSISKATEVLPSIGNADSLSLDFEEDMRMKSRGLSSTLEKLYIWEKKLYEEVKVEEKIRIALERKCTRLQHLDERGAEAYKIEATRIMVRDLSAKMRIALHFVDSIAHRISKLRDEDLWPQIELLIQGFMKMWKIMLECHHSQCQIVMEANNLDAIATDRKINDGHIEATMQLEQDLLNWILSFYAWISAQKSYIKALNGWLMLCIRCEPEITADGPVPFSPGRIGAPPVFVICNHWSQVMDRISENEVFEAMQSFSMSVLNLWDKYNLEQRQRMLANKDMDKGVRLLETEEQNMQKALDAVNKKLTLVSEQNGVPPPGQIVHQSHGAHAGSIQSGLKQIFEAMERFSDVCKQAYEELHARCEEDRLSRENAKVP